MNSMNDSRTFQGVESNHSGRLSHVSSQLAMIPSSRSMLSRDKRLPLDTWNTSGPQENVFGNQFSTFDSPEIILKEFTLAHHKENEDQFLARDGKQNRDTIPMLTFAGRPSTVSSLTPVGFPQNSMVGQQRQPTSELLFDKFPDPQSFLVLEDTIQKSGDHLFWFSIGCYVVDQRSGDG